MKEQWQCSQVLTDQRDKLTEALKEGDSAALRKEQVELERRRASADEVSRPDVERLLELNAHRQANAAVFEQARERLGVQQEVVTQTFASIKSALLRASLATDGAGTGAPDITTVSEAIGRINRQARSVEEVVREVMGSRV